MEKKRRKRKNSAAAQAVVGKGASASDAGAAGENASVDFGDDAVKTVITSASASGASASDAGMAGENASVDFGDDAVKAVLTSLASAALASNTLPHGDLLTLCTLTSPSAPASHARMRLKTRAVLYGALMQTTAAGERNSADLPLPEAYVEGLDLSLELTHTALDDAEGFNNSPLDDAFMPATLRPSKTNGRKPTEAEMRKPQLDFLDHPIDNSDSPFVPPHSAPADGSEMSVASADDPEFVSSNDEGTGPKKRRVHPCEADIESAEAESVARIPEFDADDVTLFRGMERARFTYVDTDESLFEMAATLSTKRAIAVDIENHSERSFLGFTCLIQISTREEDFVIDALAVRSSIHRALGPIFADESVVKVMHGADNDVEWLERDFGIYVVNLFDTGQAARVLGYPLYSLSYLLSRFCDVTSTDKKKFQRADWRIRPLPKGMVDYARADTHYLLYVYDRLRCELHSKGGLAKAYAGSANVARRRFRKPAFKPNAVRMLAARHGLGLDAHQIRIMEALNRWRDETARRMDESVQYVLSNPAMLVITRARDGTRTADGIENVLAKKGLDVPVVCAQREAVAKLIADVLDTKIDAGVAKELTARNGSLAKRRFGRRRAAAGAEGEADREVDGEDGSPKKRLKLAVRVARTPLPARSGTIEVVGTKGSALFQDSSDDESRSTNAAFAHERGENSAEIGRPTAGVSRHARTTVYDLSDASDADSRDSQVTNETKESAKHARVEAKARSVFDLSEEDEDNERNEGMAEGESGSGKVADVLKEIEVDSRAALLKFSNLPEDESDRNEGGDAPVDENDAVEEDKPEPVYVPLSSGSNNSSKKKKRKRKKDADVKDVEKLVAFNYAAAEAKDMAEEREKPKEFDVLAGLKSETPRGKRVRKTRKNPKSGSRSMSFKART